MILYVYTSIHFIEILISSYWLHSCFRALPSQTILHDINAQNNLLSACKIDPYRIKGLIFMVVGYYTKFGWSTARKKVIWKVKKGNGRERNWKIEKSACSVGRKTRLLWMGGTYLSKCLLSGLSICSKS